MNDFDEKLYTCAVQNIQESICNFYPKHAHLLLFHREQLWRFSLSDLSLMENVEWTSTDRESCVLRGQHKVLPDLGAAGVEA